MIAISPPSVQTVVSLLPFLPSYLPDTSNYAKGSPTYSGALLPNFQPSRRGNKCFDSFHSNSNSFLSQNQSTTIEGPRYHHITLCPRLGKSIECQQITAVTSLSPVQELRLVQIYPRSSLPPPGFLLQVAIRGEVLELFHRLSILFPTILPLPSLPSLPSLP
jgi:hypothetical protein